MKHTKKVCISLTEEQCQRLQTLADESCRTRAGYIRQIIRVYLRAIEADPGRAIK